MIYWRVILKKERIQISKLYILLGNGFSMDVISRLEEKDEKLKGEIDLKTYLVREQSFHGLS